MNKPFISYCISVCDEIVELKRLVDILNKYKHPDDEIIIQQDELTKFNQGTKDVQNYINELLFLGEIKFSSFPLNNDFATFKNNFNKVSKGEWIFQLDADEYPHEELLTSLRDILSMNTETDLIYVPRINTVEGLTNSDIQKWGWNVSESGRINFPDKQGRLYRNNDTLQWEGKVHERIVGVKSFANLPLNDEYCLYHPKSIDKQRKQNEFYSTI
tara:strand:+ start:299 stop:943 length:645 start_codon:yes stop_codon:yes gene_type:complete